MFEHAGTERTGSLSLQVRPRDGHADFGRSGVCGRDVTVQRSSSVGTWQAARTGDEQSRWSAETQMASRGGPLSRGQHMMAKRVLRIAI